jgi:uncharacterized protein (DUF433 family)
MSHFRSADAPSSQRAQMRWGRTIVDGTRIGVHDVVGLIVNGASIDDVCRSFPELKRSQVYECLAYYEDHRPEIDAFVAGQTRVRKSWIRRTE